MQGQILLVSMGMSYVNIARRCHLCEIFMSNFIRICRMEYDEGPGIRKSVVGASGIHHL